MELRQLATFVAVAEQGSFTRAADQLHVVQVSRLGRRAHLEKELGVMLVNRSTHRVKLTDAGRALLPEARATPGGQLRRGCDSDQQLRQPGDWHAYDHPSPRPVIGATTGRASTRALMRRTSHAGDVDATLTGDPNRTTGAAGHVRDWAACNASGATGQRLLGGPLLVVRSRQGAIVCVVGRPGHAAGRAGVGRRAVVDNRAVPRLCAFYGIVIFMYRPDHPPPHFHAQYGEDVAQIELVSLKILNGSAPPRALRLVREWAQLHEAQLAENWKLAQALEPLVPIEPLA